MTVISAPTSFRENRDESVEDVAQHLAMQAPVRLWGAVLSSFLAMCMCGLLPLLVWPRRWNAFAERERDQMASVAGWWRRRATPMQAQVLDASVSRMGPQSMLTIVPILILVFAGMMIVSFLNEGRSLDGIFRLTVGYYPYRYRMWYPREMNLHMIWTASLLLGYTCHWMAVRSHAFAVQAMARQINEIAGAGRARALPEISSGLNPMWIVAAVVLCGMHAWWGIPLVLAGAIDQCANSECFDWTTSQSPGERYPVLQNSGVWRTAARAGQLLPALWREDLIEFMRQLYIILASVGWAWLLLVGGYLLGRFSPALPPAEGEQTHEQ